MTHRKLRTGRLPSPGCGALRLLVSGAIGLHDCKRAGPQDELLRCLAAVRCRRNEGCRILTYGGTRRIQRCRFCSPGAKGVDSHHDDGKDSDNRTHHGGAQSNGGRDTIPSTGAFLTVVLHNFLLYLVGCDCQRKRTLNRSSFRLRYHNIRGLTWR